MPENPYKSPEAEDPPRPLAKGILQGLRVGALGGLCVGVLLSGIQLVTGLEPDFVSVTALAGGFAVNGAIVCALGRWIAGTLRR